MATRYRAEQVGSLLRPAALLEARAAHAEGRLEVAALREAEDRAILDALNMQRDVGIDVYVDGELRRGSWLTDVVDAVEGFVPAKVEMEWRGPGGGVEGSTASVVGGRLRPRRRLTAHEVGFLQEHAPGPYKMTLPFPSAYLLVGYRPGITDAYYPTRADLARDLVAIVRAEVEALIAEGVPYVQLDAPFYPYFVDERVRARLQQAGLDPDAVFEACVQADAACVEGLAREGVTLACHICRGNSKSRWVAEGGYDPIAERLFGSLPVDTFLLEYDSERAGGFEPLRAIPAGKTVVLGLVTTKEPHLEAQDELRRRIDDAARYVPPENLALSPQCGFASVASGNPVTPEEQEAKLRLVGDVARRVWGAS